MKPSYLIFAAGVCICISCSKERDVEDKLFEKQDRSQTGIDFRNSLPFTNEFNIFTYRNFYNGGGVAIGDLNNDGLPDIYFTCNLGKNRLYLNKGNFKFEDVTQQAGVAGKQAWSTGVALADVNADGWLDIYVCNSGNIKNDMRENELFINNGDLTFTERGREYGLNDQGYSTHAAFFDFDKDGDLDMYLLNNSFKAIGSFNLMQNIREVRDSVGGHKLFRNDNSKFTDVSEEAGIYGSVIGFGLGVTVGDVNNDGWLDIFVSNDFFERDYLYVNNKNGTFREVLTEQMQSISAASMGADINDINNDGWLDIFVTDMLPEQYSRLKQVTTFENWDKLRYNIRNGYHYQFSRNMLHVNNGNGTFSELGRLSGIEATDWSWGALIFDMDNDGLKDIFVANGIYQDITDLDYLNFIDDEGTKRKIITSKGVDYKALVEPIPINPIPNYAFRNKGQFNFENLSTLWGLDEPSHSNGSAYGDLDNDGDLDLVVNNVNADAFVYRNTCTEKNKDSHYLRFVLQGSGKNTLAVGTRIEIKARQDSYFFEQMPTRGFESSVDPVIVAGIGRHVVVDTVNVTWPDGRTTLLTQVAANQTLKLTQENSKMLEKKSADRNKRKLFNDVTSEAIISFKHTENDFVDFNRDGLLYQMLSTQGPHIAVGDVNNDGLEDLYVGGARGYSGQLFKQIQSGKFIYSNVPAFEEDKRCEDVDALFVDFDGDQDLDLFVVSGGNEFSLGSPELINRIYLNDGKGDFTKDSQPALNSNQDISSTVIAADYNNDGSLDFFVGGRTKPFQYGEPVSGHIYKNDGIGRLEDVTSLVAPDLNNIGMITDAVWTDFDNDKDFDLVISGEWMAIEFFENVEGQFKRVTSKLGLDKYKGWWNVVVESDLDKDGDPDYIVGNLGYNSRFRASTASPLVLYVNDFDSNGSTEHIFGKFAGERALPFALKHDLVAQLPGLKKRYLEYKKFNNQYISDIFTSDQLKNAITLGVNHLATSILINNGGQFDLFELPVEAQKTPVYAIQSGDFDSDGVIDILLGGNLYEVKPEAGSYDASYGVLLKGLGNHQFQSVPSRDSDLKIKGAVRDFKFIKSKNQELLLVALNNDSLRVFRGLLKK